MNKSNPFLMTDAYKTSHHKMYPQGTTLVYSNFTPRHGKHSNIKGGTGIVSFGQQMVMRQINEMFHNNFFMREREEVCEEIKREYSLFLNEDYDVSHIERLWDLRHLPIKVKSLPEGTFVPYGVPVLTVVNTNPDFFWITNFLETLISNMLWLPMTSATTAHHYKTILRNACLETDDKAIDFVDFQGHNFAMRGMGGIDATVYAGLGHATSFKGDDSLPTISSAREYYDEKGFIIGSVNATEHSVMSAGGDDSELETFRYLMKQFPTGILSIVSDTWNLWDVLTKYLPVLKDEIMSRDGKIVIRPDSGDPVDIICGTGRVVDKPREDSEYDIQIFESSYYERTLERVGNHRHEPVITQINPIPEHKGVIELLWDLFGGTTNEQGFKVLDPHIGAIYGDSITPQRAKDIADRLKAKGFASTNVVLGIGSFTYQLVTRDTHGFAMKATYVELGTESRNIFKDPITGDGSKKSSKGLLHVGDFGDKGYILSDQMNWESESSGALKLIFEDGNFHNQTTLSEIRERISQININN